MVRSSLSQNIISAAENLNGIKDVSIETRYPDVFRYVDRLVGQRNILAQQYGHVHGTNIQWTKFWQTVHGGFPALETAINKAITDLESSSGTPKS